MAEQKHQPFEEWIFSDEALLPEQSLALQEHLRTCDSCRCRQAAWRNVERLFCTSVPVSPAPGFTNRWQERMYAQQVLRQRRHGWMLFGITAGSAILILVVLASQFLRAFQSPSQLLWALLYQFSTAATALNAVGDLVFAVARMLPSVSLVGLMFFVGFISFLSVVWCATFKQLSARRIFV